MNNRRSSIRKLYTARDVVNFVDMVDTAIEDGRAKNIADYFQNVRNAGEAEIKNMISRYLKWSNDNFYRNKLQEISGEYLSMSTRIDSESKL